ncbi:MAG: tyrosine-type recombinase/integrase [Methanomassiliicoccus sp.]|nr:tyrosine-type recombinase/integrase [Methanomassiliicoccus sp.]
MSNISTLSSEQAKDNLHDTVGEVKPHAKRRGRLKRTDIKEVLSLRLGRYPFRGGIDRYIESRKGSWNTKTTKKEERRKLEQIGKELEALKAQGRISTTDPRHLTRSDVQEYMVELRKVDPSFQNKQIGRLKRYMAFYKNHVIEEMKNEGFRMPKTPRKPIRALSEDELYAVFGCLDELKRWPGSVARGLMALSFATGRRPSELRLAHMEDLNLRKRTFFVRYPKGEGNWASPEEVGIIREDMVPLIERYVRERAAHLQKKKAANAIALFPNTLSTNGFYSANRFNQIKHKVEVLSGVDFKLKDFRSTLTTITINGDMSRVIGMSVQLGHMDPNTTLKSYNRIERSVARKRLKDVWRESPIMVSKTPSIENRFEMTGYG